ncbi:MAG: hypothetical protein OWT28_08565 [Firmicutes bacterium]|nr:hypothetical protein [Bacillota bacterium]
MERILHLHWDQLVLALLTMPDPDPTHLESLEAGKNLLEHLRSQEFTNDYLWNLSTDAFRAAWRLLSDEEEDAATVQTQFQLDEDTWSEFLADVSRLPARCDPNIGEEFL